jgi:hypothetical protein
MKFIGQEFPEYAWNKIFVLEFQAKFYRWIESGEGQIKRVVPCCPLHTARHVKEKSARREVYLVNAANRIFFYLDIAFF